MENNSANFARARLAQRKAVSQFLLDPNVSLIEIGLPEREGIIVENELALRIHVKQKMSGIQLQMAAEQGLTRPIPNEIAGVPTDVPEGVYHPNMWGGWNGQWSRIGNAPTMRQDPLHGGISISDENHFAAGTLGCKVYDRLTGDEMLLSNWHVLVADWTALPGKRIFQPGRLDGGTRADTIAVVTRHAMSKNIDAAVATLNGNRRLLNEQLNLGGILGLGQAQLGMTVRKAGRTTQVTSGRIVGVEGVSPPINYGPISRIIRHIVTIDSVASYQPVSGPGDSGACWLDPLTQQAISLHFAGSTYPPRALSIDMRATLDALNVKLATTPEYEFAPPTYQAALPRERVMA